MDKIEGQPEGVEVIKFGISGPDDYELIGDRIVKGVRPDASQQVLVKPANGYSFRPERRFDPVSYSIQPGRENTFMAVKEIAPVTIKALLTCTVSNEFDLSIIHQIMGALKNLPGFQGIEDQSGIPVQPGQTPPA
jgi:hypothetical protein